MSNLTYAGSHVIPFVSHVFGLVFEHIATHITYTMVRFLESSIMRSVMMLSPGFS
jgi:hypothetical protein